MEKKFFNWIEDPAWTGELRSDWWPGDLHGATVFFEDLLPEPITGEIGKILGLSLEVVKMTDDKSEPLGICCVWRQGSKAFVAIGGNHHLSISRPEEPAVDWRELTVEEEEKLFELLTRLEAERRATAERRRVVQAWDVAFSSAHNEGSTPGCAACSIDPRGVCGHCLIKRMEAKGVDPWKRP